MNLRNIGLVLLLLTVIYTGVSRFTDTSRNSDLLRKNIVEGFRFLRLAFGIDINEVIKNNNFL